MDAQGLTLALGGKWHGSYGEACCPLHDDKSPSLSISEDEGNLLITCHAGCDQNELWSHVRHKYLNGESDDLGLKPTKHPKFGAPHHVYRYSDHFEVWRWDANGEAGKEIRPLSRIDGAWTWKKSIPPPRPLYRLDDFENDPFKPVLLVEGEKAVEAARLIIDSHVVMTWPGGAKAIDKINWKPLAMRKAVLWPDNDSEGRGAMARIGDKLARSGSDVRIVDVPQDLTPKWDLGDFIPEDMDVDTLIEEAQPPERAPIKLGTTLSVIKWEALRGEPPERPWLVADWIPRRTVTMISGDGGLGKSLLAMQLMTACALGKTWLGQFAMKCPAVGVFCEDEREELWRRQIDINRSLKIEMPRLAAMRSISRVGASNELVAYEQFTKEMNTTGFFQEIHDLCQNTDAKLLVLDSLHDFYPGNENDRVQVRRFVNQLAGLACDMDGAVVLTAHPSLSGLESGSGRSGSTAWHNAVRSRLYLSQPPDEPENDLDRRDDRLLTDRKANYAASGKALKLIWREGIFELEQQTTLPGIGRQGEERVFLEAVGTLTQQGVNVSYSPHSLNYAPKVIMQAKLNQRLTTHKLRRAMQTLDHQGAIKAEQYGRPSKGTWRVTIIEDKTLFDDD